MAVTPEMNVLDLFEPVTLPETDFWSTLESYRAVTARIRSLESEGEDKFQKGKMGKRKKDKSPEEVEALRSSLLNEYNAILDPLREQEKLLKAKLNELALTTPFREPRETWCLWKVHSTYDHLTVGFGATAYAQSSAELREQEAKALGLETRIDRESQKAQFRTFYSVADEYVTFKVMVKVHGEDDIALLDRKPGMSLREWMKACWSRGKNPRVYNPYLPPGLEEKLCIDYFGRDLVSGNP